MPNVDFSGQKKKPGRESDEGSDVVEDSDFDDTREDHIGMLNRDDAKIARKLIRQREPKVVDVASMSDRRPTMLSTDD